MTCEQESAEQLQPKRHEKIPVIEGVQSSFCSVLKEGNMGNPNLSLIDAIFQENSSITKPYVDFLSLALFFVFSQFSLYSVMSLYFFFFLFLSFNYFSLNSAGN